MYAISFPSGTIYKDGVEIEQRDDNPVLQEYLTWLRQDNTPTKLEDTPPLPSITVTAWQLIQALNQVALLEVIDTAVSNSTDILMKMGWQRAPNFTSDEPLVINLCKGIGISDSQRQDIFTLASAL
jgi:hypothetical protein